MITAARQSSASSTWASVEQAEPVRQTAAVLHRLLLQGAQPRSGLAGGCDARPGPGRGRDKSGRRAGHAAQAAEEVERRALHCKQAGQGARYTTQHLAGAKTIAVLEEERDVQALVDLSRNLAYSGRSGKHAGAAGDDAGPPIAANDAAGQVAVAGQVLCQGASDRFASRIHDCDPTSRPHVNARRLIRTARLPVPRPAVCPADAR